MADSANAYAGQWMPVARIDDSPYEVEGFVKLLVEIEGDVGKGALFLYKWRSANAIESGETDKQKLPVFNFIPPHEGKYYISADVYSADGVVKSAGAWVLIGEDDEAVFDRPEIPDDSV